MKKDIIIAIIIGFFIGSIAALFAVNLPSIIKRSKTPPASLNKDINPVISSAQITAIPVTLDISEPADESLVTSKNIKINGKTQPNNIVSAISDADSDVIQSENGTFSLSLDLREGGNNIYLTSTNENGDEETKILTVFYTTEKL
jgi:hypothetical protein